MEDSELNILCNYEVELFHQVNLSENKVPGLKQVCDKDKYLSKIKEEASVQ